MPKGSTSLGFFVVNGEQNRQQVGSHVLGLRATHRSNIAPGRDRVFANGLFFLVRGGKLYTFLVSEPKRGSAVFTLRDSDGQNVLINAEVT